MSDDSNVQALHPLPAGLEVNPAWAYDMNAVAADFDAAAKGTIPLKQVPHTRHPCEHTPARVSWPYSKVVDAHTGSTFLFPIARESRITSPWSSCRPSIELQRARRP